LALSSCAALALTIGVAAPASADTSRDAAVQTVQFQIPVQSLASALSEFARQSGRQLLFTPDIVSGKTANAVVGSLHPLTAFDRLIAGSGLKYSLTASGAILLRDPTRSSTVINAAADEPGAASNDAQTTDDGSKVEKVTVTGTRIRGAKTSSPVITITGDDMKRSGQNNVGEAMRALPQNFAGGQNPGVAVGASAGSTANQNVTGGSSPNLRGLGPDATVTLLNGSRLPFDGLFQTTDVSMIPVAAIERIEVLLDGASAIYGSDAVGGVVNIILKRDYDGAELSARFGAATEGGYEQQQYTALAGRTWTTGGFLVTADYSRNTSIVFGDRDNLSYVPNQSLTLYPGQTQTSALFSGHQQLGELAEFSLDAFYNEREQDRRLEQTSASSIQRIERDSTSWGVAPTLLFTLSNDWSLKLNGVYAHNESNSHSRSFSISTGALTFESLGCYCNQTEAVGLETEGPIFALPGGDARISVGGGYRKNSFQRDFVVGAPFVDGSDKSSYAYAEVNLPLVSEEQEVPLMTRLSLNGAVRHERYDSFGDTTTPKVGLIWGLTPELDLRASWGRSFKVPTLLQQFDASSLFLYPAALITGSPAGSTPIFEFGGNPNLGPERAEVVTAGLVARPKFIPGLGIEFEWFDIDYTDRVDFPLNPLSQALINPAFAAFVTLNPTLAQQQAAFASAGLPFGTFSGNFSGVAYDPANVNAILHDRYANTAVQSIRGVDLTTRYRTEMFGGELSLLTNASWIDSERRLTNLSPSQPTAGVIYFAPQFRFRGSASWSRDGLTLTSVVNHTDGVKNTNFVPYRDGDDMTTLDVILNYEIESGPLSDVGFNLVVSNVFDEQPPFLQPLQPFYVNFDSTNYSAVGRVVSVKLTKRF